MAVSMDPEMQELLATMEPVLAKSHVRLLQGILRRLDKLEEKVAFALLSVPTSETPAEKLWQWPGVNPGLDLERITPAIMAYSRSMPSMRHTWVENSTASSIRRLTLTWQETSTESKVGYPGPANPK